SAGSATVASSGDTASSTAERRSKRCTAGGRRRDRCSARSQPHRARSPSTSPASCMPREREDGWRRSRPACGATRTATTIAPCRPKSSGPARAAPPRPVDATATDPLRSQPPMFKQYLRKEITPGLDETYVEERWAEDFPGRAYYDVHLSTIQRHERGTPQ